MGLNVVAVAEAVQTGAYLSWWKILPVLVLLLIWVRLLTWVDKDTVAVRLPRIPFNLGTLGGLILAFVLFLALPGYAIALAVFILIFAAEVTIYLLVRKQKAGLQDLSAQFKNWVRSLGGKEKSVKEIAGSVQVVGPRGLLPAPESDTPEAEAYLGMQKILAAPMENHAEMVELRPADSGAEVKYKVDGVVYNGAVISKASSASAIAYLKVAAGMDISEVRKPQTGTLKINVNGKKHELQLTTKGSTAGESARFLTDPKKRHNLGPDALGFTTQQQTLIRDNTKEPGVVILAMPKGQGLTSLAYGMLRVHDAFLQLIMTVERDAEQDLEGVTQNKLPVGASAADESQKVSWIASQQPDVMLVGNPESSDSAKELIAAAKAGRNVYVTFTASNTFDALSQWRKLVGNDKLALSLAKMVIVGRTLRKLCSACKQGYTPDPDTLRKLNMDSAKVETLYQARKEPIRDPKGNVIKCTFCNELRYNGRTGIYEILVIDDEVRQALLGGGTAAQLKGPFRKQRGRYLQEVGLALVEKGETSVQEVLRVLKVGEPASPSRQAG